MIRNVIEPAAGNVVVIRETVEEVVTAVPEIEARTGGREKGIIQTEHLRAEETRYNPWALVVAVGEPRVTQYGTTIPQPCVKGDKALIANNGRTVDLTADGQTETLYILPFEGILSIMKYECSICGEKYQDEPEGRRCPKNCKEIDRPTPFETATITRGL